MSQYKRLGHNIPCVWQGRNSQLPREPQGSCIHFSCSFLLSTSRRVSWTRMQLLLLQINGQERLLVWTTAGWSNKKRLSVHKPCLTGKICSLDVAFLAEGSWLRSSLPGLIRQTNCGQIKVQGTPVQEKAFVWQWQQKVVLLNTEARITTHPG